MGQSRRVERTLGGELWSSRKEITGRDFASYQVAHSAPHREGA